MKCPKCGYHSFDYLQNCKKCDQDLTEHKARFGLHSLLFREVPNHSSETTLAAPPVGERDAEQEEDGAESSVNFGFDFMAEDAAQKAPAESSLEELLNTSEETEEEPKEASSGTRDPGDDLLETSEIATETGDCPLDLEEDPIFEIEEEETFEDDDALPLPQESCPAEPPEKGNGLGSGEMPPPLFGESAAANRPEDTFEETETADWLSDGLEEADPAEGAESPGEADAAVLPSVEEEGADRPLLFGEAALPEFEDAGNAASGQTILSHAPKTLEDQAAEEADFWIAEESPVAGRPAEDDMELTTFFAEDAAEIVEGTPPDDGLTFLNLSLPPDAPAPAMAATEPSPTEDEETPVADEDLAAETGMAEAAPISEVAEESLDHQSAKDGTYSTLVGSPAAAAAIVPRLGAALVDLLVLAVTFVLFIGAGVWALNPGASAMTLPSSPRTLIDLSEPYFLVLYALVFGYFTLFHFLTGQTPGKMLFRIRVEDDRGVSLSLSQAFLRSVGGLLSLLPAGLGFLSVIVAPQGRGWNDRLAGSRVVKVLPGTEAMSAQEQGVA